MKTLCIAFAAALLCGCAATMNTPSGTNEVTVNAPLPKVRQIIAAEVVNRGFSVTRSEDLLLVAEKDAGAGAAVLFADFSNPSATARTRFNLLETPEGVRVVLRCYIVARGTENEVTGGRKDTQAWLESVKVKAEE